MGRVLLHQSQSVSWTGRFLVGRDSHGCWVVLDSEHRVGGLFCDKSAALHFARDESGRAPGAVSCAGDDEIVSFEAFAGRPPARRRTVSQVAAGVARGALRATPRRG